MPKFIIKREIPGAGQLSPEQLRLTAQKSCGVIAAIGPQLQWVQSFVTGDKVYCTYISPDEATIRKHAEMSGFPANQISLVHTTIDPTTAD